MRRFLIFLLLLPFWVNAQEHYDMPDDRVKLLVESLSAENWNLEKVATARALQQKKTGSLPEAESLWQGNIPRIELNHLFTEIGFGLLGSESLDTTVTLDLSRNVSLLKSSRSRMRKFEGGVAFVPKKQQVQRFFMLGQEGTEMLVYAAPWSPGQDLYMGICPKSLAIQGESKLVLENREFFPKSVRISVLSRLKALLFSGSSAGFIEASFLTSEGIPAPQEASDLARGINPVVDLVYRPDPKFVPKAINFSEKTHDFFVVKIEMQLPGGAKRVIEEGIDFWIVPVEFPAQEIAVPISTIKDTKGVRTVPKNLREAIGNLAINVPSPAGRCALLVVERRPMAKFYENSEGSD